MHIIGLHGPARAGKDTIADYLVSRYGFHKIAFSDALYSEVATAYGLPDERILRDPATKDAPLHQMSLQHCMDSEFIEVARSVMDKETTGKFVFPTAVHQSPRWILQVWGTEYRRAQNPDYWVERAGLWMQAFIKTLEHVATEEDVKDGQVPEQIKVGDKVYENHPGVVVSGVRFENERQFIKDWFGVIWHVWRKDLPKIDGQAGHCSETPFEFRTGDKLIMNYGTIPLLHTGVTLLLQGNGIVNTGDFPEDSANDPTN